VWIAVCLYVVLSWLALASRLPVGVDAAGFGLVFPATAWLQAKARPAAERVAIVMAAPLAIFALVWLGDTALGIAAPTGLGTRSMWALWVPLATLCLAWFTAGRALVRKRT
jgi:hypothetical protein